MNRRLQECRVSDMGHMRDPTPPLADNIFCCLASPPHTAHGAHDASRGRRDGVRQDAGSGGGKPRHGRVASGAPVLAPALLPTKLLQKLRRRRRGLPAVPASTHRRKRDALGRLTDAAIAPRGRIGGGGRASDERLAGRAVRPRTVADF